ncbi:MAG: hypothetical protein WB812_17060 [Woeseiaceae bacterium]
MIQIRAYNVLFGDCILVSWDEDDGEYHAWIDFGNFGNDPNAVFQTVYDDVLERTGGHLDLVVITHRHLDHMEGFYSLRKKFRKDFTIARLWHAYVLPAVDDQFQIAQTAIRSLMPAASLTGDGTLARIYRNNFGDKGLGTLDRMNDILADLPYEKQYAIYRGKSLKTAMPPGVKKLEIEVLAPEKNSKKYLGELDNALAARQTLDAYFEANAVRGATSGDDPFVLPRGTDAKKSELIKLADFARVRRLLQTGGMDMLGAVDKTRNNTSIVMRWTYEGRGFLFTGDAEETSWDFMRDNGADFSSDLVKVGHHGSINASPDWSYSKVFPRKLKDNAVLISTDPTRFTGTNEVPKEEVVDGWRARVKTSARLKRTDKIPLGSYVEFEFG